MDHATRALQIVPGVAVRLETDFSIAAIRYGIAEIRVKANGGFAFREGAIGHGCSH
jgi:hypothetical protein